MSSTGSIASTRPSVAVLVPMYRQEMTADERISLRHLTIFLGGYPRYAVVPESMPLSLPGFEVQRFRDTFFDGLASYNRLMLSPEFYDAFSSYDYVLIYQLDCLVFSDRLAAWCRSGFDYVGAPWFVSSTDPSCGFWRVGNGGLSLRKVDSFLQVLRSPRYVTHRVPYWRDLLFAPIDDLDHLPPLQRYRSRAGLLSRARKGVESYTRAFRDNEDGFWSLRARLFWPDFQVAPVDIGLRFSFECFPRYCFEHNGRQLPFGCHGWPKWDREFWQPYLIA